MRQASSLKPQDILLLAKIISARGRHWRQLDLADELRLSRTEVTYALDRLKRARLIDPTKRKPMVAATLEFLVHGLKYVFPVEPGSTCRGIPTSHSAKPLSKTILGNETNNYVWPSDEGTMRGLAIAPLYESVPYAIKNDPELHEILALIDAIRVGRAREQKLAKDELEKRLMKISS